MDHEIKVSGGCDYDIDMMCSCGVYLGRTHDSLSLKELQNLIASYEHPTEAS
jgi:hypothetical protein